jgi:hypothetical protein
MKCWIHLDQGIVRGAALPTIPHEALATILGEWVLEGVTPILYDFQDEPIIVNAPLPEQRQPCLPL